MNVPGTAREYRRPGVDAGFAAPQLSLATNMRRLAQAVLQGQPGARWGSRLSFDVLGAVVQRVAGQPLDIFVRDRIALPSLTSDVPKDQQRFTAGLMTLDTGHLCPIRTGDAVSFPAE